MPTECTREFIEEFLDDVEQKRILIAACDTYDHLETKENIDSIELQPIVNAARDKHLGVWQIGGDLLWKLSVQHDAARNSIRTLIKSKHVNERFQIMASIRKDVPISFSKEIILDGIADKKGRRVREKAAQAFFEMDIKELIPTFEAALENEQNEDTKQSIKLFLNLTRDGYDLKKYNENDLRLRFPTRESNGVGICGISVKPEEVSNEDMIKEIISKRR